MSVTSVAMRNWMRPLDTTTGREIEGHAVGLLNDSRSDKTPAVQVSPLGIGIVPPAMNLALSPETAVTFGSASVWATPCRSKACKVAVKLLAAFGPAQRRRGVVVSAPLMAKGLSSREFAAVRSRCRSW